MRERERERERPSQAAKEGRQNNSITAEHVHTADGEEVDHLDGVPMHPIAVPLAVVYPFGAVLPYFAAKALLLTIHV
jgi:hypothetical protein